MASAAWGMTQHRDPGDYSFIPLPWAINHRLFSSISNTLPFFLLEPRVSGCKQNCIFWPLKRLSESPTVSPLQTQTLLLFIAGCYLVPFWFWCCRLGSPPWGLYLSGGTPNHWNIPPELQLLPVAAQPALSHLFCTSYHSHSGEVVSSVCLGYKVSLKLVFSWLFSMISLQFTCNSRLVLGGSYCSFHLLLCHLWSSDYFWHMYVLL